MREQDVKLSCPQVLDEVFKKIRKRHTTKGFGQDGFGDANDWVRRNLIDIVHMLKNEHEFVLGAFVRWVGKENNEHKFSLVEIDGQRLFFGANLPEDFTKANGDAFSTLKILEGDNGLKKPLFLSSIVYRLIPHRANLAELVIRCNNECCDPSEFKSVLTEWGKASRLGALAEEVKKEFGAAEIDKELLEELTNIEKEYVKNIQGYFKSDDSACYLLVYCPFLVNDKKPPGNFFGVFKRCTGKHCSDHVTANTHILPLLTTVQMAGTLVFSQISVDELSRIENHEKYNKVIGLIGEIKKEADTAVSGMNAKLARLEHILNPFGMWAGVKTFDAWKDEYMPLFGGFNETGLNYSLHNPSNWKRDAAEFFIKKFKASQNYVALQVELGTPRFEALFKCWIHIDEVDSWNFNNNKFLGGYIAKMLISRQLPLLWISYLTSQTCTADYKFRGIEINNDNVPILSVIAALYLRTIAEDSDAFKATITDFSTLLISFKIKADSMKGGTNGLTKLIDMADRFATAIQKGIHPSDPTKNQTAHSLAVLRMSSGGQLNGVPFYQLNVETDTKTLNCSFTYNIADEFS